MTAKRNPTIELDEATEWRHQPTDFVVKAGYSRLWVDPTGILCAEVAVGDERTDRQFRVTDALSLRGAVAELAAGRSFRILVDARGGRTDEPGVRRVQPLPNNKRMALWVGNPVTRMLANAYLRVARPVCPTRLFTSREKAMRWLSA